MRRQAGHCGLPTILREPVFASALVWRMNSFTRTSDTVPTSDLELHEDSGWIYCGASQESSAFCLSAHFESWGRSLLPQRKLQKPHFQCLTHEDSSHLTASSKWSMRCHENYFHWSIVKGLSAKQQSYHMCPILSKHSKTLLVTCAMKVLSIIALMYVKTEIMISIHFFMPSSLS